MIRIKVDAKALERQLDDFARKQVPFATAKALTATAKMVQGAEKSAIRKIFDNPTPFTVNAVVVRPATKASLQAAVLVKDIAAAYLEPYEDGGDHYLGGKRGLLVPKNVSVNQYGNLPRAALARLKGNANVFVGTVKFRSGQTVSGVWQRPPNGPRRDGTRGAKGNTQRQVDGVRTGLKLLIRFEDPLPVKQRLGYQDRGRRVVANVWRRQFAAAFASALQSARRP
ncbi:MAG: hypothetical protein M0006_02365 [Magnetospirillum sp.]|nr:hypothetical protein [Magnetospirillum sp.]